MIDSRRWEKIKELFDRAVGLAPEDRPQFLVEACRDDVTLRSEIERLIAHHCPTGTFLDDSPSQLLDAIAPPNGNYLSFPPGEIIGGRFKISRFIGHGGMGEVYEAEDLELGARIALKTLRPEISSDVGALNRFKQEVQLARRVTHPNVCRMFDIARNRVGGQAGNSAVDQVFLTMELLNGESLSDRLQRAGRMETECAWSIIRQMANALHAAHQAGVIHRDFKPSNVILVPAEHAEANQTRAVVTDFGLARAASASTNVSGAWLQPVSTTGHILGTPAYMAPEQLEGRPATAASDIYAFGLVLYEMLTAVRPFEGDTPISSVVKRLTQSAPAPGKFAPGLSPLWEWVILRCLERDPANRFATVENVIDALTRAAEPATPRNRKERRNVTPEIAASTHLPSLAVRIILRKWSLAAVGLMLLLLGLRFALRFTRQVSPEASPGRVEYTQLTNFADSVTSPVLSPDGRMLAMIRGNYTFLGPGEIWVKMLPSGEPVQLTHDTHAKMGPVFSADGSRIAFTRAAEGWDWQTWTVPVLGGEPSEMLPNASALTWVGPHQVMFSEMGQRNYLKIVTADESRANQRDVYLPAFPNMAHRSYLSPNSKWVLVVEMDDQGWTPCRLVPFIGAGAFRTVGPVPSQCAEAAWSEDGRWMYFSANTGTGYHLWRQRFPVGAAEQITFGATEEHGIAVAPDGKSLITSVGSQQSTVWLHTKNDERQISSEGFAYRPVLSRDGGTFFYLVRNNSPALSGQLRSVELKSDHNEEVLPNIPIARYAISPDRSDVVFTRTDDGDNSGIWISPLDRHSPPRQLVTSKADMPVFSRKDVFFLRYEGGAGYVYRIKVDGSQLQKAIPNRISVLISASPDGRWIVGATEQGDAHDQQTVVAYPLLGGRQRVLCRACAVGDFEPIRPDPVAWSADQRLLYVCLDRSGMTDKPMMAVIPLKLHEAFPPFVGTDLLDHQTLEKIRGVRMTDGANLFPGPDRDTYAIWRMSTQRNLYRISSP